jgi:hypothetical protein
MTQHTNACDKDHTGPTEVETSYDKVRKQMNLRTNYADGHSHIEYDVDELDPRLREWRASVANYKLEGIFYDRQDVANANVDTVPHSVPAAGLLDLISGNRSGGIAIDATLVPRYTRERFLSELENHRLKGVVEFKANYHADADIWVISWEPYKVPMRGAPERYEGDGNPGLSQK